MIKIALLEIFQAALSFFILATLIEALFGSVRDTIKHQRIMQGKLIFFLYSLFVYYGGLNIKILFWEMFINEPIRQAYGMINYLTTNLLNVSIESSPMVIFKYLVPAIFIYYFVDYWMSYAFMDKRLSKMVSIAALIMLYKSNMAIGFINWQVLSLGIPTLTSASISPVFSFYAVTNAVLQQMVGDLSATLGVVVSGILTVIALVLIYMLGGMIMMRIITKAYGERAVHGGSEGRLVGSTDFLLGSTFKNLLFFIMYLVLLILPFLLRKTLESIFSGPLFALLFQTWLFVIVIIAIATIGELFFFGAMSMFASMIRTSGAFKKVDAAETAKETTAAKKKEFQDFVDDYDNW
ncbi:MAG: hypothetical protein GOV00_04115 [Candidatus Altiarchaeota archaeon]|nr:hypothetical protein [Candidatus Altiarchaeota archaeon]